MKIKQLKINGFGKLKQKEINLKDGINIIYGENEAGKSTLLKFISCMFFGASKNKNGKEISDFDKFKPWKTEEFSGKMQYELESKEKFEVYREFKKKNPIIYNEHKEDISKKFKEDKVRGIDFLKEQTGIDEQTYFNTAITEQAQVALSSGEQTNIIQKISNFISSGNDNISYKKSLAQINKLQTENVGTERTALKPINILNNRIKQQKEKLEKLEDLKLQKEADINYIEEAYLKKNKENIKFEFLKKVQKLSEANKFSYAEIDFIKKEEKDYIEKIEKLEKELIENPKKNLKSNKSKLIIFIIIFFIIGMIGFIFLNNMIGIGGFIGAIFGFIYLLLKKKNVKEEIITELNVLKKNKEEKEIEIDQKLEEFNKKVLKEKQSLIEEYKNKIDIDFLENAFEKGNEDLLKRVEEFEKSISKINLEIHEIELNNKIYNEKLEDLSKTLENLKVLEEEKAELLSLNNSYNLAKEALEKAYEEVKKNISPQFTNNLCKIISIISNGKYNNIKFIDKEGLIVELENGNYMSAERLSIGTIDQMYLSLRLSALEEISKESMPIILDEAFAYFDNERLKNILNYLSLNYKEKQILIFTCSNREKEILDKLNIEYNMINLEK